MTVGAPEAATRCPVCGGQGAYRHHRARGLVRAECATCGARNVWEARSGPPLLAPIISVIARSIPELPGFKGSRRAA
jgi:hypothetical protein